MKVYLVQHGDALPKEVDPQRPLSDKGRADVERIASFLGTSGLRIPRILHSGKQRAEQTAELLAAAVGGGGGVDEVADINPLDPTGHLVQVVGEWTNDTMVVGHLPFLGRLASRLVAGDEAASAVRFMPGTVVCLERGEQGSWSIAWMIRPELVARPSGEDV
jgi:phosphohistidine phosphatase